MDSAEWKRVYQSLEDHHEVVMLDGDELTTPLAIQRITRLQQVTSGYIPSDDNPEPKPIPGFNPRTDMVADILADTTDSVVIWVKYRHCGDSVAALCDKLGESWVRIKGGDKAESRRQAVRDFQDGKARVFIGTEAAAGAGITLLSLIHI